MTTSLPIYHFADRAHLPTLGQVGGKGFSLIKMSQSGLAIPPGFVLAVDFFKPWIDLLKQTPAWQAFLIAEATERPAKIQAVKLQSMQLFFTPAQQMQLDTALANYPNVKLFAIRSSSPEEDLAGASFAGGYETVLGVTRANMENAIKTAFASCLDPRVFSYKKEQGFATNDFSIAVVVMAQIASDIAGVAFSINPISNDNDEMIINANWGLGETVVAGLASPDQYIVNKVTREIVEKRIGEKQTSIWLLDDGGTVERADPRYQTLTLSDHQLLEISDQLYKIETLYQMPMDIEWAYQNQHLYLLQARPITTSITLPTGMKTGPGEPRRLYLDVTLSVQGLEKPMTPLGTDFVKRFISAAIKEVLGKTDVVDIKDGIIGINDGKLYINLSNIFTLVPKDKVANLLNKMDAIASTTLKQLEPNAYKPAQKPAALKFNKVGIAFRLYDVIFKVISAPYRLSSLAKQYDKDVASFAALSDTILASDGTLTARINRLLKPFARFMVHDVIYAALIGQQAMTKVNALFAEDAQNDSSIKFHLDRVSRSLPHNLTIEMGLNIYQLSTHLQRNDYQTSAALLEAFEKKQLPEAFYKDWDTFIKRFGARGLSEFDMASARYEDTPSLLINQIYSTLMGCDDNNNPIKIYKASQKERTDAYQFLLAIAKNKGHQFLKKFIKNYAIMEQFGGYRENHKFFLIVLLAKIRKQVLTLADQWVAKGLLKNREQIFNLTFDNIAAVEDNKAIDLDAQIALNTAVIKQIAMAKITPALIDSRGKILRMVQASLGPNEIGGHAVSSGKVTGRIKVLHTPDEKPLLAGEILVARATDPGWTPLFVNAGAIVLEIGGMLQHGALVAREYGKPCVAGVANATEIFKDGELVEVDGAAGIIKRLKD